MCYSALVKQLIRDHLRQFNVLMDYEEALRLFKKRKQDRSIKITRGFEWNFEEPKNDIEMEIKELIEEHRAYETQVNEQKLFEQKRRLTNARRALELKETKKARNDARIASKKIDDYAYRLSELRRTERKTRDDRVFAMNYAGIIVQRDGRNILTPMRYFCLPAGKPETYIKKYPGLYIARKDNLEGFWREQFGKHHALAVFDSFYENVRQHDLEHRELAPGEESKNVVLHFTPRSAMPMLVACLWSAWTGADGEVVNGFAAITDDPPPEIAAAGHNRCPISIWPENVESWLTPGARTAKQLHSILADKQQTYYEHEVLAA